MKTLRFKIKLPFCIFKKIRNAFKCFVYFVVCIFYHMPVASFSDDKEFDNKLLLKEKDKFKPKYFSFIKLKLGHIILHVFSRDLKNKKFLLYRSLNLIDNVNSNYSNEDNLINEYKRHISKLDDNDLNVEKEKLLYLLEKENNKYNVTTNKIYTFMGIFIQMITFLSAFYTLYNKKNDCNKLAVIIGVIILSYLMLNCIIISFKSISIEKISYSSFSDLKKSYHKDRSLVEQYYYDWRQLKKSSELYANFLEQIQKWMKVLIIFYLMVLSLLLFKL